MLPSGAEGAGRHMRDEIRAGRKWARAVLISGMAAGMVLLTGCGAEGTAPVVVQNQNNVTISMSWWGNDERHAYTLSGLGLFHEEHPDITVSHMYGVWDGFEQRNRIYMESHTEADVMQINFDWLSTYSPDGDGYYDLEKLKDVIDLSNFTDEDLAFGTKRGKLNALPIAYNSTAFFYNKTLYDKYGLALPKSWDDLFAAAKKMSGDGLYPIGLTEKQLILSLAAWYEQTYAQPLFSDDGKLNADQEKMKATIAFYKKLITDKVMPAANEFDATVFSSGKTAGAGCWSSDASRYCDPLKEKGDEVVIGEPLGISGSSTTGWHIKPATMLAINVYTDYPEEAGELLNFMMNDPRMAKLQGTEKGVPVSKTALKTLQENNLLDTYEALAGEQLTRNKGKLHVMTPILENSDMIEAFRNETDKYLYGKEDLDTCADNLISLINAIG